MIKKWKEKRFNKYCSQLIGKEISLWEVPEKLRHNPEYAWEIYIIGFRADRMISKERYLEDLAKMKVELLVLERKNNTSISLLKCLRRVYNDMVDNLELFDIYAIADFH